MPEPIQNPIEQGGVAGGQAEPPAGIPPQPSIYKDLQTKKGFKSEEDLAKSYIEAEQALGRHQNIANKVKEQLENAGYILDEEGNIKPSGQPTGQPSGYPPQTQPPQETIYDPYTGQPITDPIALQLARLPVGQREAFIFNAMQDQRERQQGLVFEAEQEILSKPEAKGFENDIRKVMQALPLAQRANKKEWEKALLQVKGARYDLDKKNWAQQGVEGFINKEEIQQPVSVGGTGSGTALTQDQEQSYQWYQKNQPGMFKDRAHFAKALTPTGGR